MRFLSEKSLKQVIIVITCLSKCPDFSQNINLATSILENSFWALREGDISFLSPTSFKNLSVTVSYYVLNNFGEHHKYTQVDIDKLLISTFRYAYMGPI